MACRAREEGAICFLRSNLGEIKVATWPRGASVLPLKKKKRWIFAMTSDAKFPDGHLSRRIRNRKITNVRVSGQAFFVTLPPRNPRAV